MIGPGHRRCVRTSRWSLDRDDGPACGLSRPLHGANLESLGLHDSQKALLLLTQARHEPRGRLSRRSARRPWMCWSGNGPSDLMKADPEIAAHVGGDALEALFDLGYHTKQVDTVFRGVFPMMTRGAASPRLLLAIAQTSGPAAQAQDQVLDPVSIQAMRNAFIALRFVALMGLEVAGRTGPGAEWPGSGPTSPASELDMERWTRRCAIEDGIWKARSLAQIAAYRAENGAVDAALETLIQAADAVDVCAHARRRRSPARVAEQQARLGAFQAAIATARMLPDGTTRMRALITAARASRGTMWRRRLGGDRPRRDGRGVRAADRAGCRGRSSWSRSPRKSAGSRSRPATATRPVVRIRPQDRRESLHGAQPDPGLSGRGPGRRRRPAPGDGSDPPDPRRRRPRPRPRLDRAGSRQKFSIDSAVPLFVSGLRKRHPRGRSRTAQRRAAPRDDRTDPHRPPGRRLHDGRLHRGPARPGRGAAGDGRDPDPKRKFDEALVLVDYIPFVSLRAPIFAAVAERRGLDGRAAGASELLARSLELTGIDPLAEYVPAALRRVLNAQLAVGLADSDSVVFARARELADLIPDELTRIRALMNLAVALARRGDKEEADGRSAAPTGSPSCTRARTSSPRRWPTSSRASSFPARSSPPSTPRPGFAFRAGRGRLRPGQQGQLHRSQAAVADGVAAEAARKGKTDLALRAFGRSTKLPAQAPPWRRSPPSPRRKTASPTSSRSTHRDDDAGDDDRTARPHPGPAGGPGRSNPLIRPFGRRGEGTNNPPRRGLAESSRRVTPSGTTSGRHADARGECLKVARPSRRCRPLSRPGRGPGAGAGPCGGGPGVR